MVLDISAIRAEDGGDPAKIKKLQTDRFKVKTHTEKSSYEKSRMSKSLIKLSNWITNGERNNLFWSEPNLSKILAQKQLA